jgi:formylglycine-generating enzyme required for sulfatase activity
MHRWFLSYNSQDSDLAQSLEQALRARDSDAQVFFAPKSLRTGGLWLPALATEIAEATAFLLLVGKNGIGPWQAMEYYEALDRRVKEHGFPIVLVLLDGQAAPGLPFLRQLHWIVTADPSSEQSVARIREAAAGGGGLPGELWRYTAPYRGLQAMTESDADFFFGRQRETAKILGALAETPDKLVLLLGNSGVGKSSVAQAGVLAALIRQGWTNVEGAAPPWPRAFDESRRWCFLKLRPGTTPVRALVEPFLWTWQFDATDPRRAEIQAGWVNGLIDGKLTLRDLLDATQARYRDELDQPPPPAFFLSIDQGEELYVRSEERERRRFSDILAHGIGDPRLRVLMSMRADFFGELQGDEALYAAHRQINVAPLREAQLNEVVSRPAARVSARFETGDLASLLARRAADESTRDAGALPLLSYLLDDMWSEMVKRGDGVMRLPKRAIELGDVLADRADQFLADHPASTDAIRRIFTLNLATVREDGQTTRRQAPRSEFSDEQWRLVSALADHPNRLLATSTSEAGVVHAEVAHEAIFRRWARLRDWIKDERDFLAWRTGLEAAQRTWAATPADAKSEALLMGAALTRAQGWLAKHGDDLAPADRDFIERSAERERHSRARVRRSRVMVYALLVGIIAGLVGWINQSILKDWANWYTVLRPYQIANVAPHVLTPQAERSLKAGDAFRECKASCPEMVVIPAGDFLMGSSPGETGRQRHDEDDGHDHPHRVFISKPFAISKFLVTFSDWDTCVSLGRCIEASDAGFGHGLHPVINVNLDDARQYVAWLSTMTGKTYRLITEAEWEYAARAGTKSAYFWGDEFRPGYASCKSCGNPWDDKGTSPVDKFKPNPFGLHDMAGNVWEWTQDCYHASYEGAPTDGSAWLSGNCKERALRGGAWGSPPGDIRSASRGRANEGIRASWLGFRVVRVLGP